MLLLQGGDRRRWPIAGCIFEANCISVKVALQGKILEMLRQRMPSGLQNENLVAVGLVGIEQMPR